MAHLQVKCAHPRCSVAHRVSLLNFIANQVRSCGGTSAIPVYRYEHPSATAPRLLQPPVQWSPGVVVDVPILPLHVAPFDQMHHRLYGREAPSRVDAEKQQRCATKPRVVPCDLELAPRPFYFLYESPYVGPLEAAFYKNPNRDVLPSGEDFELSGLLV